tara:strand:- start:49 stop:1641 length:1593 start_codon:yes stop_codon:yes gene_type:complete
MTEESEFKKKLKGLTAEVGGGVGTDLATGPLLAMGPKGWVAYGAINAFQGGATNYHVQRYLNPDEAVNWGEVVTSGLFSAIPFMDIPSKAKYAKYLGKPGTLKRAVVGGSGIGLAQQQILKAYDEGEFLTPVEAGLSIGIGGATGGATKVVGDELAKRLFKNIPYETKDERTLKKMQRLFQPNFKNKVRNKLAKMGLIDPDGNITITELDKRELAKSREFWERITEPRIAALVKEFDGTPEDATLIFADQKKAWGRQKSAAGWLNKYFKALTTELNDDGVPLNEVVLGQLPNGKIKFVQKGSPNSYPYAFEVDHRRAIQEMRELGIPLGVGANFSDNLDIVLSVFNRAKNNLGNPSLPADFTEALGISTTLKDMIGKYYMSRLATKSLVIPQVYKDRALKDMLEELQAQLSRATAKGMDVTPRDIKNFARESAIREVKYWKSFGQPLLEALEQATETAPADIQRQIDADRWAGNVNPDIRWEELQYMGIFDYLSKSLKKKYKKASDTFINTKRGLRAKMNKDKFYQDPND